MMDSNLRDFEPAFSSYDEQVAYWESREESCLAPRVVERRKPASTASLRRPSNPSPTMGRTRSVPDLESRKKLTIGIDTGRSTTSASLQNQPKVSSSGHSEVIAPVSIKTQPETTVAAPTSAKDDVIQSRRIPRFKSNRTHNATNDYLSSAIDQEVKFPPLKPPRAASSALISNSRKLSTSPPEYPAPRSHQDAHSDTKSTTPLFSNEAERSMWCHDASRSVFDAILPKVAVTMPRPCTVGDSKEMAWREMICGSIYEAIYSKLKTTLPLVSRIEEERMWCHHTSDRIFELIDLRTQTAPARRSPDWTPEVETKWRCKVTVKIFEPLFTSLDYLPSSSRINPDLPTPAAAAAPVKTSNGQAASDDRTARKENAVSEKKAEDTKRNQKLSIQVVPYQGNALAKGSNSQEPGLKHSGEASRSGHASSLDTTSAKGASNDRESEASRSAFGRRKPEHTVAAAAPLLCNVAATDRTNSGSKPSGTTLVDCAPKKPSLREEQDAIADAFREAARSAWRERRAANAAAVTKDYPDAKQDARVVSKSDKKSVAGPELAGGKEDDNVSDDKFLENLAAKISGSPSVDMARIVAEIKSRIPSAQSFEFRAGGYRMRFPRSVTPETVSKLLASIPGSYNYNFSADGPVVFLPPVAMHIPTRPRPVSAVNSNLHVNSQDSEKIGNEAVTNSGSVSTAATGNNNTKFEQTKKKPFANSGSAGPATAPGDEPKSKKTKEEPLANPAPASPASTGGNEDMYRKTKGAVIESVSASLATAGDDETKSNDVAPSKPASTEASDTKLRTSTPTPDSTGTAKDKEDDLDEYVMVEDNIPGGSSYMDDDWLVVESDDGF